MLHKLNKKCINKNINNNNLKLMRNLNNRLQKGKFLCIDNNNDILIKVLNKQSYKIFERRDFYEYGELYYNNKNYSKAYFSGPLLFWQKNIEKDFKIRNKLATILNLDFKFKKQFLLDQEILFLKVEDIEFNDLYEGKHEIFNPQFEDYFEECVVSNYIKLEHINAVQYILSSKLHRTAFNTFLKEIYLWKKIAMLIKLKLPLKRN